MCSVCYVAVAGVGVVIHVGVVADVVDYDVVVVCLLLLLSILSILLLLFIFLVVDIWGRRCGVDVDVAVGGVCCCCCRP